MKIYHGKIFSGLGVSSTRTQQNAVIYKQKSGMDLYPGTLNVTLTEDFLIPDKLIFIDKKDIKPDNSSRNIRLILAKFRDIEVIIMSPDPMFYDKNIIEVMAVENLREKYNLKDGDEVEIQL